MSQKTLNLCLERYNFVKFGETTKSTHTVLCTNNAHSVNSDKYRLTPAAIASKHGEGYVFTLNYDFDRPLFTIVQKSYSIDGTSGKILFEGIDPISKGGSKYLRRVEISPVKLSDGSYLLEVTKDEYLRIGTTGAALGDEGLESLNDKIVTMGGIEKSVETVGGKQVLKLDASGSTGAKEIVYFDVNPSDPPSGIYEAITEALSNNKEPVIKNDGSVYFYSSTSTGKYVFVGGYGADVVGYTTLTVSGDDSIVEETVDVLEGKYFPLYYHQNDDGFTVADKKGHALTKTEIADAYRAGQIFMFSSYPASNTQAHWGYCCDINIESDNTGYAEFFILSAFGGDSYEWEKYRINLSSGTEFVTLWGPNTSYSTGYSGSFAKASDVAALQSQVSSLSNVSAYTVKGEATVAQLNAGPSGIQAGWAYQLTDSGTLTDGSLAVVAGDTVAWDGTKWFPLVKSDYYATKTYAQNVAHSIAPEFVPNETNAAAGMPYMYGGQLYVAKENYNGPWNVSKFTSADISNMDLIQVTSTSAPYNDFNSFPLNKVLLVVDVSNVANAPSAYGCVVQTIAFSESAIIQYVSDAVGNYFVRSKYADTWSIWSNLAAALINLGNKTATGIFADLNTFPLNRTVLILNQTDVANKPVNRPFTVTTFGSTDGALMQLLSTDQRKIYIRAKFSTSWGEWMCVDGALSSMGGVPNTNAPFNDLDTYPDNRCYLVGSNYSGIANKPANRAFFVITIAPTAGAKLQYFVTDQRKIYVRAMYSSWGDWMSVDGALSAMGGIPNAAAPFDDFNTYPVNRTYFSSATTIKNAPVAEPFNVATIAGSAGAVMQFLSTDSGKIFARAMWSNNWKPWKRLDIEDAVISPVCAFNEFIAIGDSITYGQVQTAAKTWRRAYKSWPEHVAQATGVTQTTYAVSGYTASDSWNAFKDQFVSKTNALAFIFLGTNGGLTDTLDTDAPSDQPYSSWADTDTGCYAKIIAKLQDLGYKIVLIKPYIGGGDSLSVTQNVISKCGSRFHACVLEPMRNDDLKYHYWPDLSGSDVPHFNDLGYCQFASFILSRLASAPTDQMKWIIPS